MREAIESMTGHARRRISLPAFRRGGHLIPVLVVAAFGWAGVLWNTEAQLTFTGWRDPIIIAAALLICSALCWVLRPLAPLSELAMFTSLWIAFTNLGAVHTYFAAAASRPLMDEAFARLDVLIGFDWQAWIDFVREHLALNSVLRAVYGSLLLQVLGSIALFSLARIEGRNAELLSNATVALVLTSLISALLPALGPWVHYGYGALVEADTAYVSHTLALRQGGAAAFALSDMRGIICFPSYHTVLAVLFVHAHRGVRYSFPVVATLNAVMLVSIPSEGGHYLIDIFAGAVLAVFVVTAMEAARRAFTHPPLSAPGPAARPGSPARR
jgi:hypothetical protein